MSETSLPVPTENHSFVKESWPDLDRVIQFLPNDRGVWAACALCGLGLRGWPSIGPTATNARIHLDRFHAGWDYQESSDSEKVQGS